MRHPDQQNNVLCNILYLSSDIDVRGRLVKPVWLYAYMHARMHTTRCEFKLSFLTKYPRKFFTNDTYLATIHCGL